MKKLIFAALIILLSSCEKDNHTLFKIIGEGTFYVEYSDCKVQLKNIHESRTWLVDSHNNKSFTLYVKNLDNKDFKIIISNCEKRIQFESNKDSDFYIESNF